MTSEVVAWLLLRAAVAGVYLYAAYRNTRDATARSWTLQHTALLFDLQRGGIPLQAALTPWIRLCAWSGMASMYAGGLSVLLGLEARLGGALLAAFTAAGIYQHLRESARAMLVADVASSTLEGTPREAADELRWSAFAGHFSSGLKNYALVAACLWFVLQGSGPASVSDVAAAWLRAR